ncbi:MULTISPECIES: TetR/AcrR family transcriptional regulator [unclassified Breznakia]|uniref:TetR/AcrR family transcriptional regulator n=1 Tax=unclassified Breznakia TaxID=2623764 RepID=UPI0024762A4C|nr:MULTISPECIES: TetR/AcrR family transcriptional regulator [unclassified Breznakia]MDH6367117.1 AcrR family transcriptional regulator [Breznakia sp. PH1-1]MDH6404296.1 AcrR family transcriptional regulator [Breznakia sp. PF1-11]MDH6412004.1 AcrR family transcriptional regulator [Breznakia sp. PFB1-11]MDH6414284.1 AcrR family transcriptional regulator [Breznakia sp. PFB1-14]MDH6416618.1 AcrR family transcriptional regulator [Breznakia sp. PFB1-4]
MNTSQIEKGLETKHHIDQTLKEMIVEMPFHKITVQEVTKRCKIHRKTFYIHYPSLDDYFIELQDTIYNQLMMVNDRNFKDVDEINYELLMQVVYDFINCDQAFYNYLMQANSYMFIFNGVKKRYAKHVKTYILKKYHCNDKVAQIISSYVLENIVHCYRMWLEQPDEISFLEYQKLTANLVYHGLKSLNEIPK